MKFVRNSLAILLVLFVLCAGCKKQAVQAVKAPGLSYGNGVFYISNQATDVTVAPVNPKTGNYDAFPEGLAIDKLSGVINVSQSEAGLRYRVTYTSPSGDTSKTYIVISGINFPDKYYYLDQSDTIAYPVYNADPSKTLPSGIFDEGKVANNSGCAMKTANGQINLAESIRSGLFGTVPKNDTRKDFDVKYRLNDLSESALNKIKILLYYYDTPGEVPADLQQLMQEHLAMTLQPNNQPINSSLVKINAKPRPPCIVVIGHR